MSGRCYPTSAYNLSIITVMYCSLHNYNYTFTALAVLDYFPSVFTLLLVNRVRDRRDSHYILHITLFVRPQADDTVVNYSKWFRYLYLSVYYRKLQSNLPYLLRSLQVLNLIVPLELGFRLKLEIPLTRVDCLRVITQFC